MPARRTARDRLAARRRAGLPLVVGDQSFHPLVGEVPRHEPRDLLRVERQGRHQAGVPAWRGAACGLVDAAVTEALRLLQPAAGGAGQLSQLAKEVTRIEGERSRLANAIATGGELEALAMKDREGRLATLSQQRQAVEARVARSRPGRRRRGAWRASGAGG